MHHYSQVIIIIDEKINCIIEWIIKISSLPAPVELPDDEFEFGVIHVSVATIIKKVADNIQNPILRIF